MLHTSISSVSSPPCWSEEHARSRAAVPPALSAPGAPARVGLALIRAYKLVVSPWLAGACRFVPGCADYTAEAIARHGLAYGVWLGARRLSRCHPFGGHGYDPVPLERGARAGRGGIVGDDARRAGGTEPACCSAATGNTSGGDVSTMPRGTAGAVIEEQQAEPQTMPVTPIARVRAASIAGRSGLALRSEKSENDDEAPASRERLQVGVSRGVEPPVAPGGCCAPDGLSST